MFSLFVFYEEILFLDSSVGRALRRVPSLAVDWKNHYSSIAQLVERSAVNRVVVGSSPTRGACIWPRGQAVKTSPFHGGNTGSIPVGVI